MAMVAQNICMPPAVPFLCVEVGYYMLHGKWLTVDKISFNEIFRVIIKELPSRAYEWLIGSLVLGPVLAVLCGIAVYYAAKVMQSKYEKAK